MFTLEPDIAFHIDLDLVRPVYMVRPALRVEAHPSCLPGPAIKFGIGWVVYPDFLSPLMGYHRIGLMSGECFIWSELV